MSTGSSSLYTDIWPVIASPDTAALPDDGPALRRAASHFAALVSPVLADFLLAPWAAKTAVNLIERDIVERDTLSARFALSQQRKWARILIDAGFEIVFLKGFALAHGLYPAPELRMQGDLDFLLRERDLAALIDFLGQQGCHFRHLPGRRWGHISDASFAPCIPADGTCNLDIHIRPDCYPAHRSLTTEHVFASARQLDVGGFSVAVPAAPHAMALIVTNAVKDKLDLFAIRKVIDAMVMCRSEAPPDWREVERLAHDGGFYQPLRMFCCLIDRLGVPDGIIPEALRQAPGFIRAPALARVIADFRALFPHELPLTTLLAREWLLCAEPAVAFHNIKIRARGVIRPWDGIPAGAPTDGGSEHTPGGSKPSG